MDGDTGLTLFEPNELKLSIVGNEEDDEEALEDQKRRDELLKAQLEKAFDDWSDEEDEAYKLSNPNVCSSPKSSTDDDDDILTKDRVSNIIPIIPKVSSRRKLLHKLSDISERSVNKSDCHSTEISGVFSSGTELSQSTVEHSGLMSEKENLKNDNQLIFKNNSPKQKGKKFVSKMAKSPLRPSGLDNTYESTALESRREFVKQNQPIFKNIPSSNSGDKFVPLFVKTNTMRQSPEIEDTYYGQAAIGDFDGRNEPVFKNNHHEPTSEKFQPFFVSSPSIEQSLGENEEAYKQAELSSQEQIDVLYRIRLKEIERLTAQLEAERNEATAYKQRAVMQMALLQSEKERALLSRTEADKLLVASKEEISNYEKEVASLKETLEAVEKEKKQSGELLEMSRVEIQELEDRMALMERCDSSMRQAKQTNIMVKDLKSKHQEEVGLLQAQLETVSKKLQIKEEESRSLAQRLDQLTVEKSATISQLTRSLEDSQRQCQQLLETNVMAENVELNHKLNQVSLERDQLAQTVNSLQEECRTMRLELETISPTDSMVQMGMMSSRTHSRLTNSSTNLQAELHRALLNQKAKRAEVERLQTVISAKEKEIQDIKRQQQASFAEKEELSVRLRQKSDELDSIRSKYEEIKNKNKAILAKANQRDNRKVEQSGNEPVCDNSDTKREAELKLKEVSVRLDQSLREIKELKDKYLEVTNELGKHKGQLEQVTEERNNLDTQLQTSLSKAGLLLKDKNELLSEIMKLKDQLTNNEENEEKDHLRAECARLQNELSSMSVRHAQELSSARTQLQATRDRVSQLEKTTRLQFETKIKSLVQECEMFKSKCDEKEVQIRKLIESRKRTPSTANAATATDKEGDGQESLEMELSQCRKEFEANLEFMKKVHQDVIEALQQKHSEEKENMHRIHLKNIAELERQLITIEEQTKEKTIHFFSEKVQELENKYQEQLKQLPNPSEVVRLHAELADQARQIDILSESLERANEVMQMRLREIATEKETEKRHLALLLEQWSHEMKCAQEELKLKEDNLKELNLKLESANNCAKTNYDKLVKTNKEIIESMNNKLSSYRSKVMVNIENYEKDVWEKVKKIEVIYRRREKRLYQEFKKQLVVNL